ncbi:hypothetical protein [Clostridium lundense]|uniref:hypothetical protein n=1 Tax=Clostridium lundense TaxID=319475 RepID=UPI0004877DF6|nr:hypothetical protein [Clostridium lundense]
MGVNIIIGFIIPWIVALAIVRERKIIYYIAPFAIILATIINASGLYYFWAIYPFELGNLSIVPLNTGLFCLFPCVSFQIIKKYDINAYTGLPVASLIMTLIEGSGVLAGRIVYYNHWNIILTYFSYLIPLLVCYGLYKFLKKRNLI